MMKNINAKVIAVIVFICLLYFAYKLQKEYLAIKEISSVLTRDRIESSLLQNSQQFGMHIDNIDKFYSCVELNNFNLAKVLKDENFFVQIETDSIKIYKEVSSILSFFNFVKTTNVYKNGSFYLINKLSKYHINKQFFTSKRHGLDQGLVNNEFRIVQQDFASNSKGFPQNYFIYDTKVFLTLSRDETEDTYTHTLDRNVSYIAEKYIIDLKMMLNKFLIENEIDYFQTYALIPSYYHIPPPG